MTGPERDVYTGNSGAWQQSLRGASRSVGSMTSIGYNIVCREEGESTRGRPRTVRSQSTSQPQPGRLGPGQQQQRRSVENKVFYNVSPLSEIKILHIIVKQYLVMNF